MTGYLQKEILLYLNEIQTLFRTAQTNYKFEKTPYFIFQDTATLDNNHTVDKTKYTTLKIMVERGNIIDAR